MESCGVLLFCLIQCIYSFVSVRFLPAAPTFSIFNFMTVFEAKSSDHPGWVEGRCTDKGGGVGRAAICGIGAGSTSAGSAIIGGAGIGSGARRMVGGMFS
jgi:hypothetical protein